MSDTPYAQAVAKGEDPSNMLVYDDVRKMDIGTVADVAALTGRAAEDVFDTISIARKLDGDTCSLRKNRRNEPVDPNPAPPPTFKDDTYVPAEMDPRQKRSLPPPASSPAAAEPRPPRKEISKMGRTVEELNDKDEVIGSWPTAAAAEAACGIATNSLAAAIRARGSWKGRRFRFAGEASAPPQRAVKRPTLKSPRPSLRRPAQLARAVPVSEPPVPVPLAPSALGPAPILNILSALASMAIGSRQLVLSDVELQLASGGTTTTVKIKQVSLQASAS